MQPWIYFLIMGALFFRLRRGRLSQGQAFAGAGFRRDRLSQGQAWDVHRARLFGRCERKTGIAPFERLVAQVMGAGSRIVPRAVCSLSRTMAPPTVGRGRLIASEPNGPMPFWFIRRSMPVG
jgi:hypothetical protein